MRLLHALFLSVHTISLVSGQKWTIHESCANKGVLQDTLIKAMKNVKDKSANAVKQLEASKGSKGSKVRDAATWLLGKDNYNERVDEAIVHLSKLAALEGPIGEPDPSNLLADKFMHHKDWKKLGRAPKKDMSPADWDEMMHWKDFVIYCAPEIKTIETEEGNKYPWDIPRNLILGFNTPLLTMKEEGETGQWKNPKNKVLALTQVDEAHIVDSKTGEPRGGRRLIPETITLNPKWLLEIKEHDYEVITKERIELLSSKHAYENFKSQGVVPVDALMGLEGNLRHECFHLSAFGKLKDRPSPDAYKWENCISHQDLTNPDTLAYLAMVVDLADTEGLKFSKEGKIKN